MSDQTPQILQKRKYKKYKVKTLDWDVFANMLRYQCTEEEIAGTFDMSVDTLSRRCIQEKGKTFAELRRIFGGGEGKSSLRRRLWKMAMSDQYKGTVTAAIWLSKNYLGMTEKIEDDRFKDLKPIIIRTSSEGEIKLELQDKKDEEK